ncbi:helix-hairpin-helix domain-containing protein [Bremerella cremea]|uniref:Helix-hairpin-helix domain-containing protein n=1 Tax=Bremerella cremea TaxID=1031537 RepID=A0A368KNS8_9BACT|nr:helix-hairpin-helix domain-containing protein [Bremerella cremea]RCS42085.1 helix-hairpin-helix domain-containing protein [Bremerella cremea]
MGQRTQKDGPQISVRSLLRRGEQLAIALVVAGTVVLGGIYFATLRMRQVELIDIDEAPLVERPFMVDVNQAEWAELAQLPGVGETIAKRIVESRQVQGPFLDHSDLQRVPGIGPRTVESLRGYLVPMPQADSIVVDAQIDPAS